MAVTITDNTDEVLDALAKAKQNGLTAIGMVAETYAKDITPVDTGRLRNSITHEVDENAAYIGTNVEYAPYVEMGSSTHKAHHMLQRAATEHADAYKQIFEAALRDA